MDYDETDAPQAGASAPEDAYEVDAAAQAYEDAPAAPAASEGQQDAYGDQTYVDAIYVDEPVVPQDVAAPYDDPNAPGEPPAPAVGDTPEQHVASIADILADGDVFAEDGHGDEATAMSAGFATPATDDPADAPQPDAAGNLAFDEQADASFAAPAEQAAPAFGDIDDPYVVEAKHLSQPDAPVDPSVELLPATQVIQPASSVSSMANASYSDDADSKAAVAALEARRRRRRRKRILVAALVAVVVAGAAAVFLLTRGASDAGGDVTTEPLATATVTREDFTSAITAKGPLQPVASTTVTSPVEGTLAEMRVTEGDVVSTGDVLFIIKSETLEKALSDANAQLASANATLTTREAAVRAAYDAYNSGVAAYNAGDVTVSIEALRAAITSAEAMRDEASAAVSTANTAVSNASAELAKCTVTSPADGTVVAVNTQQSTNANTGAHSSGVSVEVADISQLKVAVQVNEMDIAQVAAGQQATFTFAAFPDVRLTGTVESIATMASNAAEAGGATGGVVTFNVTLLIPLPDPQLKPGMTASATILTENVPNALVIPLSAVAVDQDDPTRGVVSVVTNLSTYAVEPRDVTLGARSSTEVVVTDGLKEGEVVALVDNATMPIGESSMALA